MKTLPSHLNPYLLTTFLNNTAWRAINEIRKQRHTFESQAKITEYKEEEDVVTSADKAAQEIYVNSILECYPLAGIVAEEDFSKKCEDPNYEYYFTVDPLDGTKAFKRGESSGVGTLISFVFEGQIVAACVGDVMTKEIYYTRAGSANVHQLIRYENHKLLSLEKDKLSDSYVLIRDHPSKYSNFVQIITNPNHADRFFKSIEVKGGSIGISYTNLWKNTIGAMIFRPHKTTPWDFFPCYGISEKLGYKHFYILEDGSLQKINFEVQLKGYISKIDYHETPHLHFSSEVLVIHESKVKEYETMLENSINYAS